MSVERSMVALATPPAPGDQRSVSLPATAGDCTWVPRCQRESDGFAFSGYRSGCLIDSTDRSMSRSGQLERGGGDEGVRRREAAWLERGEAAGAWRHRRLGQRLWCWAATRSRSPVGRCI
jgi:hypothetical protein